MRQPLGRFLAEPSPTEEQISAEWSKIRNEIRGTSQVRMGSGSKGGSGWHLGRLVFATTAAAVILVGVTTYVVNRSRSAEWDAMVILVEGPRTTTLRDGSRVMVASGGKVRVSAQRSDLTQIAIETGEAEFDVTHRPSRPFVVSAGDVDVRVLGTRFRVRIEDRKGDVRAGVRVLVSRGTVEVSGPYDHPPIRVHAGEERWLASDLNTLPVSAESPQPHDGQRLFEQANLARRSGHAGEAVRLYDLLLARFPNDDRAGLAALELGRLRMDALGDLRGAVAALREAAKTIPHGSLHEDAQARLVDALDGLRDRDGCRRARAEYLARYQRGVHAMAMGARCAAR